MAKEEKTEEMVTVATDFGDYRRGDRIPLSKAGGNEDKVHRTKEV